MKWFTSIALWLVATAAKTVIVYFAVQAADAAVTDRPLSTFVASDGTILVPGPDPPSTSTTGQSTATDSSDGEASMTTVPANSTTEPSTASSTTTAQGTASRQSTVTASGGLVVLSYRPEEVRLAAVVPHPGFSYQVKDGGPPKVTVEFQASEVHIEVRAEWDGGLVTEVDEDA